VSGVNAGGDGLAGTVVFKLGAVGSVATEMLAARIEGEDLKPKHAGLMTALATSSSASQQELAVLLGVAPSLVVALADHLETLGAVRRVRDPADRRRQILTLTEHGHRLLDRCRATALEVERELLAGLTAAEKAALDRAMTKLARRWVLTPR
jgi:DNA-binding MarR family transcriptional regulator